MDDEHGGEARDFRPVRHPSELKALPDQFDPDFTSGYAGPPTCAYSLHGGAQRLPAGAPRLGQLRGRRLVGGERRARAAADRPGGGQ